MRPDSPLPGSLTVPPLHGWWGIVAVLVLAAVVGVGFLIAGTTSRSASRSGEWEEWLEGRSRSIPPTDEPAPGQVIARVREHSRT